MKTIPIHAGTGPEDCKRLSLQEFLENPHMKVVKLSALHTGRLYLPGDITGSHFFLLDAESTKRPDCGRKDYVNEKSQRTSGNEPATLRLVAQCVVLCIALNRLPKFQSCV